MATLSELADAVAAVEGIDPATVALIARYIREAGLISTGGRGPSAATMTLTDAANLLIGVNATTTAAEAARIVPTYRELEAHHVWLPADPADPADGSLIKYGTLGEAIEQLIYATTVGRLPKMFLNQEMPYVLQEAFDEQNARVALTFSKSEASASAVITPTEFDDQTQTVVVSEGLTRIILTFLPPKVRGPPRKKKNRTPDRIETTTIGYRTLSAVGKLFQP